MMDERKEAQACLYVLGALPPEEARRIEETLPSDIELQLLVQELRSVANTLALAAPRRSAPANLKMKVLARIGAKQAAGLMPVNTLPSLFTGRKLPWTLAAASASVALALLLAFFWQREQRQLLSEQLEEATNAVSALARNRDDLRADAQRRFSAFERELSSAQNRVAQSNAATRRTIADLERQMVQGRAQGTQALNQARALRGQLERTTAELDRIKTLLVGIANPDLNRLSELEVGILNPTPQGPSTATGVTLWDNLDQRGVLIVQGLTPPPPDRDYQLWVIDRALGRPVSAGVFLSEAGHAHIDFRTNARIEVADGFAISLERKGGAPAPAGSIVMVTN